MTNTLDTKLQKFLEEKLSLEIEKGWTLLLKGEMLEFEKSLRLFMNQFYDQLVEKLLKSIGTSKVFRKRLKSFGQAIGLHRLKKREVEIQIGTGSWIRFESYYAYKDKGLQEVESRHLSCLYWGCIEKSSPYCYSLSSALSVICPSFEVARQLIDLQGIKFCYTRIRKLSIGLGKVGRKLGEKSLLGEGESVEGKQVVIQLDGGRSRMREYNGEISKKGKLCYDTPWREPKLFVIRLLDDQGNVERKESLPFYWATLEDSTACLKDLAKVLKAIQIQKAKRVQFVADGALFIWKHIRQLLIKLGIKPKDTVFTIDYFHAVEHLSELKDFLPQQLQTKKLMKKWKDLLWSGSCYTLRQDFKRIIGEAGIELTPEMKTALKYFKKHHDRMQYKTFRRRKLLCGSGLVESAIRRVINLRFKSASSFWLKENLEQLIFLRCGFLSGRWRFLIDQVANRYNKVGIN